MPYRIRWRNQGAMNGFTVFAPTAVEALAKAREMLAAGGEDVVVFNRDGAELSLDELEQIGRDAPAPSGTLPR